MSIIMSTDSYKVSHFLQYPEGTQYVHSYIESRGSEDEKVKESVFFGLQIFLKKFLSKPITQQDIDFAADFYEVHGEPFYREGWQHILDEHQGLLPVRIDAVPEGPVIPLHHALVTIVNTDPKCFWLTSYLETALLRAVWYGTTVATQSREIKKLISSYFDETSDDAGGLAFKLHDFGARGVSSQESAEIGGAAHIINFLGSDTVEGVLTAMKYYNETDVLAFSIPAAEHSTITSWGRDGEVDAYRNMIEKFAKPGSLVAVVSDSYDLYEAVEHIWGGELKQEVIDSGATIVIRPDSGDPTTVVLHTMRILEDMFGVSTNLKGYKVLHPSVRVIQGDGIDKDSIESILKAMKINNYSVDNIAFGMGGALLQHLNRDTLRFAMKCSAIVKDGEVIEVYKDPKTDPGKRSKRGILRLVKDDYGNFRTVRNFEVGDQIEVLENVFLNGEVTKEYTFSEVRTNAEIL